MIATTLISIPQWGTVTLIELLWLLSGLLALVVCTVHLPALVEDHLLTLNIKDDRPQLRVAARANLRRELIRIFKGGCITGLGIYACVQPALIPGPAQITIVGLVVTAVFLSIAFATSLMSWWDWHDRQTIQGLIALGYNGPRPKEETP